MTESQPPRIRSVKQPGGRLAPGGGHPLETLRAEVETWSEAAQARSDHFNRWLRILLLSGLLVSALLLAAAAAMLEHRTFGLGLGLGGLAAFYGGPLIFLMRHFRRNANHERDKAEQLQQVAFLLRLAASQRWSSERVLGLVHELWFTGGPGPPREEAQQLTLYPDDPV